MRLTASLAAICFAALPTCSQAGTYFFRDFAIPGATDVAVSGLNDAGFAVGTCVLPSSSYPVGFVGRPGQVTFLPRYGMYVGSPESGIPAPTAINNRGTIVGTYLVTPNVLGFAFKNGVYSTLNARNVSYPIGLPYVGTADHVSVTSNEGDAGLVPAAGTLSAQTIIQTSTTASATVMSINGNLDASGQYSTYVGKSVRQVVFFANMRHNPVILHPLLPPKAQAAFGGWINDAGKIAGSYQDNAGGLHGFTLAGHTYTTFEMPTAPVSLTVQGIDGSGRVVGVYSDAKSQHGFIYAAGAVTKLGAFSPADQVHVGISHFGRRIAVSDVGSARARSWLATCKAGSGC